MSRSPQRARAGFIVTAIAAMASASIAALATAVPAATAGTPTMVAAPASALVDGEYVQLLLNGFPPFTGVALRQCIAKPVNVDTDCTAVNTQVTPVTDAKGSSTTYLPVYAGSDNLLQNSAGTGSITCDATHSCVIEGFPPPGDTDLATAFAAPIAFAVSPDNCPPGGANQIFGSGSAAAYRAMFRWETAECVPPASLPVGYTVDSSPDGTNAFLNPPVGARGLAFGVTGPWAPSYAPKSTSTPPQTWQYAPITNSAVVLAYRMYQREAGDAQGPQITSLILTPQLVAEIFLGQIPNWNATSGPPGQIHALNPGITFPGSVSTFARAEHSAQTVVLTSWLAATAGNIWKSGAQEIYPEPPSGVSPAFGSRAVGVNVVNLGGVFPDTGTIGFMDSSTAAFYGLPTARIKLASGAVVAATPASIEKAVTEATTNSDGTITPNYGTTDAYPLLMPTSLMAPTNNVSLSDAATIASFLHYAVQAGQTNLPTGYAPLSANQVTQSLKVVAAIPVATKTPVTPVSIQPPRRFTASPLPAFSGLPSALPAWSGVVPQATPGAVSTASRKPTAVAASASSATLLLAGDASRFILPAVLRVGVLSIVFGGVAEVVGRRPWAAWRRARRPSLS